MPRGEKLYREEFDELLKTGLIRPSKSHWASPVFYVTKHSELVRGKKRLVIDYRKPNDCLQDIRDLIPRREQLHEKMSSAKNFSKLNINPDFGKLA